MQKWLDTDYTAKSRAAAFFAGIGLVVCQLAINTIDNAFSTGMDMAGLFPSYINIRRGAYVGLVLSIAMCPWELLASAGTFISVLGAYGVFLGPMTGIMVCDYFVLRRRRLKLSDLYHPGQYTCTDFLPMWSNADTAQERTASTTSGTASTGAASRHGSSAGVISCLDSPML